MTNIDWRAAGVCVALAAMCFIVFGQTLSHDFVNYDDNDYVYENTIVQQGVTLKGLYWAVSHRYADNWHPLTWISHMLDCQLYGLNPAGHHLTNVALHSVAAMLLFLVLREMTGAFWRSAAVAAIFAVHPLRAESVAWVAERKDVLSGVFFFLTIAAYVGFVRRAWSWPRYGLVMFLFALGLMAKPMLVTIPCVLLLLDFWPLRRGQSFGKLLTEKIPLIVLSAISCVVTIWAQERAVQSLQRFSMPLRLANAVESCAVYVKQTLWPANLAVFYPFPQHIVIWELAASVGLVLGISATVWFFRRKQPWFLVGWLWYLAMLTPVLGIMQVGGQSHADRYTYLPGIGLLLAGTWAVAEWSVGWKNRTAIIGGAAGILLTALTVCDCVQTTYWRDTETMWNHALAVTSDNIIARYNLGTFYMRHERYEEAADQYQQELKMIPDDPKANYNLGLSLFKLGRVDEAIAAYQTAVRDRPDFAEAHYNLAIALQQKGKLDDAISQFATAARLKPLDSAPQVNLANVLLQKGDVKGGIAHLRLATQINPASTEAENDLGNALLRENDLAGAVPCFERANKLNPSDPWVKSNLAWILATAPDPALRNGPRAVELASQANDMTGSESPIILHALAAAYAESGQFSAATETAQRASALAKSHGLDTLVAHLRREIKLYQAGQPLHIDPSSRELNANR